MTRVPMLIAILGLAAQAQTVRIGVFTLFRPTELRVAPAGQPINAAGAILEGHQFLTIRQPITVAGRDGSAVDFVLSIPGKIERRFHGTLDIRAMDRHLIAVVTMDREVAVASVAAAEMPASTPLEALKAQAVIARSYYAASPARHDQFDFCDTTHCQFLREPPASTAAAFQATRATRGLLLEYAGKPFAPLYSASCGGQTRRLGPSMDGYPYYEVACEYCRRHAPGVIQGHQLGLCQRGAAGMAASGAGLRAILDHYYPGTVLAAGSTSFSTFLLPHPATLRHSKN